MVQVLTVEVGEPEEARAAKREGEGEGEGEAGRNKVGQGTDTVCPPSVLGVGLSGPHSWGLLLS